MSNKMSTDFSVHPAAAIFPMMTEERLAELTVDIKAHGLRKRIEIWRDPTGLRQQFIIDGRNRLEACKRAGIEPEYRDVTSAVDDPIAYVASVNLKRRDLTASQRAAIIAELATLPVGSNQHRKEPVSRETPSPTLAKVAKGAGVSRATLARAKAVKKAAPALAEKVKAGTTTVNSAYKQVKAATEKKAAKELVSKPVDEYGSFIPLITPPEPPLKRGKPGKQRASNSFDADAIRWLMRMDKDERIATFSRLMTDCEISPEDLTPRAGSIHWPANASSAQLAQTVVDHCGDRWMQAQDVANEIARIVRGIVASKPHSEMTIDRQ